MQQMGYFGSTRLNRCRSETTCKARFRHQRKSRNDIENGRVLELLLQKELSSDELVEAKHDLVTAYYLRNDLNKVVDLAEQLIGELLLKKLAAQGVTLSDESALLCLVP